MCPIDTVYLKNTAINAKVVAHLSSADKGLSIMACRSCTSAETECIQKCEEALSAIETTCQLDELLRLSKGSTRVPVDNFWELKMNNATFLSLMWVLLRSKCNYYKGLWNIYTMLELKEVMAQKQSFMAEHCQHITWAILDDGRAQKPC